MQLKDWITKILARHHISSSDQRPLYQYRIDDAEFETLKSALKLSILFGLDAASKNVPRWNAAFVMYAAEWWRREYDGSSWSWEKVFASFGADAKALKTEHRNVIVETGLRYWQRTVRVINGHSRYLGTIAIEGGLPLNQLNKSSGWLGRVFKQAIPKYARLRQTGVDAIQLVAECEYIPNTYQNSQIHAILGDMVTTVVDLKQQHRLHERSNPVGYLDQHHAAWRELFPLPIADEVGKKLLSDMITTAAKADDVSTLPLRSIRRLQEDGSVQMRIEFGKFIPLTDLGLPEDAPGRLEVDLIGSDGKARLLGAALKADYQHKTSLKMPGPPAAITGDAALQGYAIRFKQLSETIKDIPLIGGERLDNEVPWVFAQRDDDWLLEGLASVSTRAKQVRILYPSHWAYEGSETQDLATALPGKKLLAASGIIRLTDDDANTFVIKTAQGRTSSYYYLQGKRLGFAGVPGELYLGLPTLRRADPETGSSKDVPTRQLVARAVNGKGAWLPLTQPLSGVYEIRLCELGAILFRKKCALLPEQFAVRFKASATSLDGAIFLDHTGNAEVICEKPIRHRITSETDGYRIDLFTEQTPPSQVRVTLRWPGMTEMLTLTLPFPARGGQVINADGVRQPTNQPLFQDQLHGVRLHLFNEQPDRKRHLRIEFMLIDDGLDEWRDIYFRDEMECKGAVIELAVIDYLDWIKDLLAVSSNLDSFVQLAIDENGSELLRVKIGRYPFSLKPNWEQGAVSLSENDHACLSCDTLNGIELAAMRLSQPEQEHIKLEPRVSEHTATGSWLFHPEKRIAEPWLIYPAKTSSVSLRPIVWDVGYDPENNNFFDADERTTLHSAAKIGLKPIRQTAIQRILHSMSTDFGHSGWDYLRQLWRHCPHLPLSSFDVWTATMTDARVLAALVLQMDEAFTEKLNEELPVFWELVSLADWLAVYKAYQDYLPQAMDESDADQILAKRIDKIGSACHSLDVVAKMLKRLLCGVADQEINLMKCLPPEQIQSMIDDVRQELDRRQADSSWPTVLKSELIGNWQKLDQLQQFGLNLKNIPEHHHAVVILPILLAVFCVNAGAPKHWLDDTTSMFKLKRLKAFDEDWFNTIFKWALAYLPQQP